jgi:hypothetical protein
LGGGRRVNNAPATFFARYREIREASVAVGALADHEYLLSVCDKCERTHNPFYLRKISKRMRWIAAKRSDHYRPDVVQRQLFQGFSTQMTSEIAARFIALYRSGQPTGTNDENTSFSWEKISKNQKSLAGRRFQFLDWVKPLF